MSDGIAVEITVTCVVNDLHEAADALRAVREACAWNAREVRAWAHVHADSDKEGGVDGAAIDRA